MSLGALTTIFTPSPSCLATTNIWQVWENDNTDAKWYEILGPPSPTTDCMPSGYKVDTSVFYSPGRCPSGYSVASSNTATIADLTETTHVCCPTAFDFTTQETQLPSILDPFMSSILCQSTWGGPSALVVTRTVLDPASPPERTTTTLNGGGWLRANGVVVKFRSGDFDSKTSSSTSQSSSSTSAQSPISTLPSSDGSSGLSTGASIGVGVGVGIFGLAMIVGLVWFLLRLRRKKRKQAGVELYSDTAVPEWRPPPAPQEMPVSSKYAHQTHEAAANYPPQELEARN